MYYSHRHPLVPPMAHYLPEFSRPSLHRSKSCTWRIKTLFFFFSTPFFFLQRTNSNTTRTVGSTQLQR
jgi:hypothetical protein